MNDASEEEISFGGQNIGGFTVGDAQSIFQSVDGTLNTGAAIIDLSKGRIVTRYAGIEAQVSVERYVNAAAIFRGRTGGLALAAEGTFSVGHLN